MLKKKKTAVRGRNGKDSSNKGDDGDERKVSKLVVINPQSKTGRNAIISIVLLLVIFVGSGVAYTYFLGPDSSQNPALAAPVHAPVERKIKPTQLAANAKVSASVQTITSPVQQGSNASVSIRTNAGSKCSVSVIYDKAASADSGLGPKVADEFGTVSWTWTVEESAAIGIWPVKVTCVLNAQSAVVQANVHIIKQEAVPSR